MKSSWTGLVVLSLVGCASSPVDQVENPVRQVTPRQHQLSLAVVAVGQAHLDVAALKPVIPDQRMQALLDAQQLIQADLDRAASENQLLREQNETIARTSEQTAARAEEELSRAAHEIELLRQAVAIAEAEAAKPEAIKPDDPKADAARIENGRSESTQTKEETVPAIPCMSLEVADKASAGVGVASENSEAIVVTVYKMEGCTPCRWMEQNNKSGDSRVAFFYTNATPPAVPVLHGNRYFMEVLETRPFYTWVDAHGVLRYNNGRRSTDEIWELIQRNDPPVSGGSQSYAATGFGGTLHGMSAHFDRAESLWDERIGLHRPDGSPIKVKGTWRRTGGQTIPLINQRPDQWKVANVFGSLGEFEFDAPYSKLPVQPLLLGYRRSNGRLVLRGEVSIDEADVGLPGDQHASGVMVAGSDVDPAGFGPMTLLTIVSVARDIFAILHPTCDLTLGGTVSATAWFDENRRAFVIDFQDMPSIKLVVLWQFDLGVKQLVWQRDNLHVEFTGSRWIKSRDFKGD